MQSMHRGVVSDWDIMARTWDNVVNRELVDNNTGSVAGVHRPFPDVLLTHGLREAPQDREVTQKKARHRRRRMPFMVEWGAV